MNVAAAIISAVKTICVRNESDEYDLMLRRSSTILAAIDVMTHKRLFKFAVSTDLLKKSVTLAGARSREITANNLRLMYYDGGVSVDLSHPNQ